MNKDEFKNQLKQAFHNGTLITAKHDPEKITITWSSYRTVVSHDMAHNFEQFIESDDYDVIEYTDNNPNHSPYYYEVVPTDPTIVAASGINAFSPDPESICDRLVAVSGFNQGWHIYGENRSAIRGKIQRHELQKIRKLRGSKKPKSGYDLRPKRVLSRFPGSRGAR